MKQYIFRYKKTLVRFLLNGFMAGIVFIGVLYPNMINTDQEKPVDALDSVKIVKTIKMVVTAYSSTEDQTDDTPFITASNKKVRDGIIAINGLPFGTRVRIPELYGYGDNTFVVEDRLHQRKGKYHADIWMADYEKAKEFGVKWNVNVEILES
jgi:3D (Asp-Asp-Asp) domain-containing protein